jgi:dCMP deaminase
VVLAQQITNKGVIYNRENYFIHKKDEVFLNVVEDISELSTCVSFKVGCIIVNDNRIISMGYNGTPAGCVHCYEMFDYDKIHSDKKIRKEHHEWSLIHEIHAEINAILYAAKKGIAIDNSVMYCTLMPCNNCLKAICSSGVKKVYYSEIYDKTTFSCSIVELLRTSGVKLIYTGELDGKNQS